jgi:hypothetical protein
MRKGIPVKVKNQVALRAGFKCEYCLLPDKVSFYNFHIDHIRSLKHGGTSYIENLAYCCPDCNHFKGTDIASFDKNDELIRFFNPRSDDWNEHFEILNGMILGKTDIGIVTEQILKFNDIDRLIFRIELIKLNQY